MSTQERSPEPGPDDGRITLRSCIVERDDGPDECTLFPHSVDTTDERMSAWISARGDAFVDCRTML
ncbi:DUF7511 domain-containing protein [Haloglomus litoreum]|uniref:DUF7511 domain-containing protein n=1 Tax=Haloglomus litoreum TaxID=3034026 RepID=UPI0023E89263|nr:hypothetical protein [Haloglomus sp. DT116]